MSEIVDNTLISGINKSIDLHNIYRQNRFTARQRPVF